MILLAMTLAVTALRGAAAPVASVDASVGFEQRLGAQVPGDVVLRDETGTATTFAELLAGKPAVLVFGYSRCPQLCSVVANGIVQTLRAVKQTAGRDFSVVYVSIDPSDTTRDLAALKRRDVGRYGRSKVAGGWHYVTGTEAAIRRLTTAAGFRFTYDERQKLFSHASGFVVLTPDGRASQYFLGVDFDAQDIAHALERAADGKTGQSVFNLVLRCARGLGISGKYGKVIWVSLEIAVTLTVIVVFGGIAWMLWQERRGRLGVQARLGAARSDPADREVKA